MDTKAIPAMTNRVNIIIDTVRNGSQERAYGPHVTDATIEISLGENSVGSVYYLEQAYAERVIRSLLSNFCDGTQEGHDGSAGHYFSAHLRELVRTEFEERRRAKWHVRIESPFTD